MEQSEVKVAVLEQKLQDLGQIVIRMDTAIEKMSEVNNNVSRMLAVHEERLSKQEKIDNVLFIKIDQLRDKMDGDHNSIRSRLSLLERRLWITVGVLGAIAALSNPNSIKMMQPLFRSAHSVIIQPTVAFMNGSS